MPRIRLLVDVGGDRGPVYGLRGDIIDVDRRTAAKWADGERAELVEDDLTPPVPQTVVETATAQAGAERAIAAPAAPVAPASPARPARGRPRARTGRVRG